MFTNVLSKDERLALVKTLAFLAYAGGERAPEDAEFVVTVGRNLGLDVRPILNDVHRLKLEEILPSVGEPRSKRVFLQALVNLGYADGEYCEAERAGIRHIAGQLGIDEKTLLRIEEWVERGVAWTHEGYNLLIKGE